MMLKKIFLFLVLTCLPFSLKAQPKEAENYDSGKARIKKIMAHEETGIAAYTKKQVSCAETRNLEQDLNIPKIAESFQCSTTLGEAFLEEALKNPVRSADKNTIIARRTNAIRSLVSNPDLKKKVGALLKAAQRHEQEVIKSMSDFFIGKTCPELKQLETLKEQSPALYPLSNFLVTNPTGKIVTTGMHLFGLASYGSMTAMSAYGTYLTAKAGLEYKSRAAMTSLPGLMTVLFAYTIYKDYSIAAEKRVKLHSFNQLIKSAESIEKLCSEHGIETQFTISSVNNVQGVQLLKGLKASRYQRKDTLLFSTPSVHTFLYELYQEEKNLAPVFACIAEMDAYNAIATKILESQSTNNKFCFATFIDQEQPQLNAQGFWNVLVPSAVPNSIIEGKNMILTGPNAGGKTTAIRALLQNVVLAQSFGIAAAQQFELTMFDVIHSYLNISDDLINGLSLFASEVKRAQEVLQKIKSLEPKTKFFFALDELFTGTSAEEGQECAYNFVKRIAEFNGVQFIYASHFHKLKELGNQNIRLTNYKVNAPTKNAAGKLVYPFTLSRGSSDVNVALDMAKEARLFE